MMRKLIIMLMLTISYQFVASQSDEKYFIKNTNVSDTNINFGTAFYGSDIAFYASPKTKSSGDNLDFYFGFIDEYGDIIDSKSLGRKVNSNLDEVDLVFTSDLKMVYFTRKSYDSRGSHLELFRANVSKTGSWSNIKKLPFNRKGISVGHPSLSANDRTLYFASNMEGTMGGQDIFKVLVLPNDRYGRPRNLGSSVNSSGNETTPFVSNNKLYFSSDGRGGLGGFDIFVAEIDVIKDARNLGAPINSNKNDYGYVRSRNIDMGYFTSNRAQGKGKDDIYSFQNLAAEFEEVAATDNASISNTTPVINTEKNEPKKVKIQREAVKKERNTKKARLRKSEEINKRRREKKRLAAQEALKKEKVEKAKKLAKEKEVAEQKAIVAKKLAKEKEVAEQKVIAAKKLAKEKEVAKQKAVAKKIAKQKEIVARKLAKEKEIAKQKEVVAKKLAKEKEVAKQKEVATKLAKEKEKAKQEAIAVKELAKEKEVAKQKEIKAKELEKKEEITEQEKVEVKEEAIVPQKQKRKVRKVRYITSNELCMFQFDNLNSVYFDYKKYYVNAKIANEVDKMIKIMKRCPNIVAIISSHTDSRSSSAFNLKLSQRRSDAIVTYILRNSNISEERIKAVGYGETKLRNRCSDGVLCSEAEHQVNRRTQFETEY